MAAHAIRNAGGVPFLILKGHFVVRAGQMPDGDTVAFAASSKYKRGPVETNVPVGSDGMTTVNIRLQSIDAPEKSQPLGAASRDALLKRIGFDPSALGLSEDDAKAGGDPVLIGGWLATHGIDSNRRPLGYVFRKNPGDFKHGAIVSAAQVLDAVKASENYLQVTGGWAFPAFYDNTDESHAVLFAAAAVKARKAKKPVWAQDKTTTGFVPTKEALKAGGSLVYPKFYRRVQGWPANQPNAKAFVSWLKKHKDGRKLVLGATRRPMQLWELFEVVSPRKVAVPYDVTKLWFSE
jgi:endonuclease YncB( thermonuclease family)